MGANERAFIQKAAPVTLAAGRAPSFLQTSARAQVKNLLERARGQTLSVEARKDKVLALLKTEGKRLGSTVLASIAMKVQADPFVKEKRLIQELIERLIAESTAEATKKGFCDVELSKAEKNRNHRWADVQRLSADLATLKDAKEGLTAVSEALLILKVFYKQAAKA